MKISVIQTTSSVGGYRWVSSVFGAIKKYYPETDITIYYQKNKACPEDMLRTLSQKGLKLKKYKFKVYEYRKSKIFPIKILNNIYNGVKKRLNKFFHYMSVMMIKKELISSSDIIFYSFCKFLLY